VEEVRYAVCEQRWNGLSVVDYALLSLLSYFEPSDPRLPELMGEFFPEWATPRLHWRLVNSSSTRSGRISWTEVELVEENTTVIAVRGTDPVKMRDFLEDIRLWTEPVAMAILGTVFPTVRIWPRETAEMVIIGMHDTMELFGLPDDAWSYVELMQHIEQNIPPGRKVVLTGHSLGGGMATVVAALQHRPVITINPPGIYYSIAKHQRQYFKHKFGTAAGREMQPQWMHHESLTMVVENDWVNHIFDEHGGLVQMMECELKQQAIVAACHMLEGTICHLLRRCGDHRHRWDTCEHEFDVHGSISSTVQTVADEVKSRVLPSVSEGSERPPTQTWEDWLTPKRASYIFFFFSIFFLIFPTELLERYLVL